MKKLFALLAALVAVGVPITVVAVTSNGGSAPVNVVRPSAPSHTKHGLLGLVTPSVGQVLNASNGTWTNSPTSYAYQWERCNSSGGSCVNESGATSSTYTVVSGDVGDTIRVAVTASNAFGSATQTSAQTGVVTASAGIGMGVSLAACTVGGTIGGSPTSCTTPSASRVNITASGSGCADPTANVCPIYFFVPGNLVTTDPSKPVPLVLDFPDGTGPTGGGIADWQNYAATAKIIVAAICPSTTTCIPNDQDFRGSSPSEAVEVNAVITYAEAHWDVSTTQVAATGGSKGGNAAFEAACNPSIASKLAGDSIYSAGAAAGSSASNAPFAGQSGSCPAYLTPGTWSLASSRPPMMIQYVWSPPSVGTITFMGSPESGDSATRNGCWVPSGAACVSGASSGTWYYSTDQLFAGTGLPSGDNGIFAPGLGCSRTPVTNTYDLVSSGTGGLVSETYEGCTATLANGNATEAQSVAFNKGTALGTCHWNSCTQTVGTFHFNIATEAWAFWTTGTTTPE